MISMVIGIKVVRSRRPYRNFRRMEEILGLLPVHERPGSVKDASSVATADFTLRGGRSKESL